jgi:amidase
MLNPIFATVRELATAIQQREVTAETVVQRHLERIAELNPQINATTILAQEAMARARACDDDLARGISRGPLHGVPFTVKDIFATPGTNSVLDERMRRRTPPKNNATVITRLRGAGAILLGKSNAPPNGHGVDTETAYTGRTLNPYNLDCTPGGSSGGEAALVAAGGSPLGLGSDQRGGLRVPASFCGVATLRPTMGRVPSTGAYNHPGGMSDRRSQIGPLARRVEDLSFIMPFLIGPDHFDTGVVPMAWRDPTEVDLSSLRVAYFLSDDAVPVTPEVGRALGDAVQALARAGVELEEALPPDFIAESATVDYYLQDIAGIPGREVVETFTEWDTFRTRMAQFMEAYDAIVCPTTATVAPPWRTQDRHRFAYTVPFSLTGYPSAVVRGGQGPDGRPIGVQVAGRLWREDVTLALATVLEQSLGGWQPPKEI